MKELQNFLKSQKVLTIGTVDEEHKPWNTNVYYSVNKECEFFFVSPLDTKHTKHISNNENVSFSVVWFDEQNLGDRKGIQGQGVCREIQDPQLIAGYLKNHYKYFPSWKESINLKAITEKLIKSRPFVITPKYIKFWNDELYKNTDTDPVREFTF